MSKLRVNEITDLNDNLLWSASEGVGGASVSTASGDQTLNEALQTLNEALQSRVIYVDTIADLQALDTSELVGGQAARVQGSALHWDAASARWIPGDRIGIEAFGAVGDGVTDNATAFADMYAFLEDYQGIVTAGPGEFYTNATLKIPRLASFEGAGRHATIITAKGSSGAFENNAVLLKQGEDPVPMAALSGDVSKGQLEVTFSAAHDLAEGAVFLIYNPVDGSYSNFRPTYRDGEFCTVASVVSATTVELEKPLYADHQASVVGVYRCQNMATGMIAGVKTVAPGPGTGNGIVRALVAQSCHKTDFADIEARGSDNSSMAISRCYKATGRAIYAHQWSQDPGFGTQYGLVFGNSQQMDFSGEFVGLRHGVVTGGGNEFSIPCRDIHVHDFVAKSRVGSVAAADWHGNTEYSSYRNGTIYGGGLNIAGNHNTIRGIKGVGEDMMAILGREISGCDHIVESVEIWTGRDDPFRSIMNIGGNETPFSEDTKWGGTFVFRDIKIIAPSASASSGIGIRNRGFEGDWNAVFAGIEYQAPNVAGTNGVCSIDTVSGSSPLTCSAPNLTGSASISHWLYLSSNDNEVGVKGLRASGRFTLESVEGDNVVDQGVDFSKAFPKTPHITISLDGRFFTGSGDRIASYARSQGPAGFIASVARVDGVEPWVASTTTRLVSWQASLDEF